MIRNSLLLGTLLGALCSTATQAEQFYLGADVGYGRVGSAEDFAETLAGFGVNVEYDEGVAMGRIFGGYALSEMISFEGGAFFTSDLTFSLDVPGGGNVGDIEVGGMGGDFSFLLRPSVASGLNGLFVRAGGHYAEAEAELIGLGGAETSTDGVGYLFGLGYDARINDRLSARVAYSRYGNVAGDSDLNIDYFAVGLRASF